MTRAWGQLGSPFTLSSLLDSWPCWSRRAVLRAACARLDVPAFAGSCVMGSPAGAGLLTWVSQIAPADMHSTQRRSPGAGTASPSQGSCGLSAAEETEARGGDAASPHVLLGWDAGGGSALLSRIAALGVYSVSSWGALSLKLLGGALQALWTPGDRWLGAQAGFCGRGPSCPLFLTGCCRTTGWEGSPQRRCGSCRACSPCESRWGGAGWAPLPGPEPQVPMVHSRPWFPREVVVLRCVYVCAGTQPLWKAAGTGPPWAGPGRHPGPSGLPPRSPGGLGGCCLGTAAGRGCS